jgi:hypothetical protein
MACMLWFSTESSFAVRDFRFHMGKGGGSILSRFMMHAGWKIVESKNFILKE